MTTPGRSVVFSYSATVRQSPAYDTTSVTSPDPIFRKLTDTVDIHYRYRGAPGRVSVKAILSNLAGWHATVPLAGSLTFAGHSYDGTVRLRLAALDARAQAAARSTGLPAGAVTVAIEPTFSSGAGGSFTPRLPLTLSPLQLSLAGTPGSLTATDPTRISQQHRVTRFLELAGHRVTVSAARLATSILALASLLTLAALAAFGASNRGETEGPRIRRRHAADLVATQPITTVPGRPLVDVDSFLTLRRVADRYGLLVLHWARSGVETFVVHDDAATYRYRTGTHSATDKQVASCDVPDAEPADSDR